MALSLLSFVTRGVFLAGVCQVYVCAIYSLLQRHCVLLIEPFINFWQLCVRRHVGAAGSPQDDVSIVFLWQIMDVSAIVTTTAANDNGDNDRMNKLDEEKTVNDRNADADDDKDGHHDKVYYKTG